MHRVFIVFVSTRRIARRHHASARPRYWHARLHLKGTMAKGNAKKRAEENVARLTLAATPCARRRGRARLVRLVVYRGTTTWWVHWPLFRHRGERVLVLLRLVGTSARRRGTPPARWWTAAAT